MAERYLARPRIREDNDMVRRILKLAALALAALVVAGGVLYALGLRIELDGGGGPHFRFMESVAERAERIARHREAQRATADAAEPLVAPPVQPAAAALPAGEQIAEAAAPPAGGAAGTYWTDFRGPDRDGHYRERPIRTDWPEGGLKPLWKQPIGGGYASFVVARGRAFTIEQRGPQEVAAAYDIRTGRELWTSKWTAAFRETMGGDGPRATPTWDDGRIYVLGGQGELRCLDDETGNLIWRTNILEDAGAANLQWGMAAAPLIVDDTVVVAPGGRGGRSVVAYDKRTGKGAWSALDDQAGYSSPMLVTLGGVRQIVVFSASRVMGLTPGRGELLWEYPWKTNYDVNASQPLVITAPGAPPESANRLFVSSGYGTGAAVIELMPNGSRLDVREVWRNIRMKNQFTSSVLHDGYIYGLDESILACVDAATGELKWKGGRYGYGQSMLASGHLIVVTEDGSLVLVRATPERHVELARFPALEGRTWNHPVIADGVLLIRNSNEMAAFDLRVPAGR
jgi:outer membrane protein assembly factor BamB